MKFQKKPVVVDAIPARSISTLTWDNPSVPYWVILAVQAARIVFVEGEIVVKSLRGNKRALLGDWIVQDEHGDLLVLTEKKFFDIYERYDE